MSIILKAENISKQYRLGTVGTGTLGDDLKRWWYNIRGKEDPFLMVGAVNDRGAKASEDYVWALRDINFEVKHGEVLGIIGKNGAGKSTLLKLLSRVTAPTTGSIRTKGRIASLLEIGTGFHPELTGRENIFMNGAVLGMTKAEINSKLDEIIDFSGCEMYIDTPVKRYSSGMKVRLGFAVAAHLEPDILVVDEVLAVGDAEFQKKAIGKMDSLSKGEGRTVLFVSHNMGSINSLCNSCIILENGELKFQGDTGRAIMDYLETNRDLSVSNLETRKDRVGSGEMKLEKITYLNENGNRISKPLSGHPLTIRFYFNSFREIDDILLGVAFFNSSGILMTGINNDEHGYFLQVKKGKGHLDLHFERLQLYAGSYSINFILAEKSTDNKLDMVESAKILEVLPGDYWEVGKNNRSRNTPIVTGKFSITQKIHDIE